MPLCGGANSRDLGIASEIRPSCQTQSAVLLRLHAVLTNAARGEDRTRGPGAEAAETRPASRA